MSGQGSPTIIPRLADRATVGIVAPWGWLVALGTTLAWASVALSVEPTEWKLRFAWSSDRPAVWKAEFKLSRGTLAAIEPLGTEVDAGGSAWVVDERTALVRPRLARLSDACEVTVVDALRETIQVRITAPGREETTFEAPIRELIEGSARTRSFDGGAGTFAASRAPNDSLRVRFNSNRLVLSPGETVAGAVVVAKVDGSPAQLYLQVVESGSSEPIWSRDEELRLDSAGVSAPVAFEFPAPTAEGVYELTIAAMSRRAVGIGRRTTLAKRTIQFLVLGEEPRSQRTQSSGDASRETTEIDLASPRLWERIARMPGGKLLTAGRSGAAASAPTRIVHESDRDWLELAPGQWHATPLPTGRGTESTTVGVTIPRAALQSIGLTVVQPTAQGETPWLLGERVFSQDRWTLLDAGRGPELSFVPNGSTPWLVIANRDPDRPARVGQLTIRQREPVERSAFSPSRRVWAFIERPWSARDFAGPDVVDATGKRTVDDWRTLHETAERLADQVRSLGATGAVVTVVSDGGGCFPSDALSLSHRLDRAPSGAAADPFRKDFVETLLRVFEREGLELVPALTLNGTFRELERQRAAMGDPGPAIAEHRRFYDPLDARFQAVVARATLDVAKRYAHRPAFAGVAWNLAPDAPLWFVSPAEGLDGPHGDEFERQAGREESPLEDPSLVAKTTQRRAAWSAWRAARLTSWMHSVADDVRAIAPRAKLLPCLTSEALAAVSEGAESPEAIVPDERRMLAIGWLPGRDHPAIEWATPSDAVDPYGVVDIATALAPVIASQATLAIEPTTMIRDSAWESKNPFGATKQRVLFASQRTAYAAAARRPLAIALAKSDRLNWMQGGAMAPRGVEPATRDSWLAFQRLPASPMRAVPVSDSATSLAVVREGRDAQGATVWCVVNSAPWPQEFALQVVAEDSLAVTRLAANDTPVPLAPVDGRASWTVALAGYEIAAFRAESRVGEPSLARWIAAPDPAAVATLRDWVKQVRRRLPEIQTPRAFAALSNPGFESRPERGETPGWTSANAAGVTIAVDETTSHEGARCLRLSQRGGDGEPPRIAWVRSAPFAPPGTRRVAVTAWMRTTDEANQPTVRIAFDGRRGEQGYYRRANVGKPEDDAPANPLTTKWRQYVFSIEDLPATGLAELQVGFDLVGDGEVWIDDVRLYDVWVSERDLESILRSAALADLQLNEGRLDECCEFLSSPWPSFLLDRKPAADADAGTEKKSTDSVAGGEHANDKAEGRGDAAKPTPRQGLMERLKGWAPRWQRRK